MSSSSTSNPGHTAGTTLKSTAAKIHGIGEAIRGNAMTFADDVTGTSNTKDAAIAQRGEDEFASGKFAGHTAGVTPKDTATDRVDGEVQGERNKFAHDAASASTSTENVPARSRGVGGPGSHFSGAK